MTAPVPTPNVMPANGAPPAATPPPATPPPPAPAVAPAGAEAPAAVPAGAPATPADATKLPPWGDDKDFDPARAWSLIENLRADNATLKGEVQPLREAAEEQRRTEQGELATVREDLTKQTAATETWKGFAVRTVAETMAAEKFNSSNAALAMIGDLSQFTTESGVDTAALQQRMDQLAVDEPGLVKQQQPAPQGFTHDRGQGQSGAGHQLPIDAQIQAAQASGNIQQSIALKQQKHFQSKQVKQGA